MFTNGVCERKHGVCISLGKQSNECMRAQRGVCIPLGKLYNKCMRAQNGGCISLGKPSNELVRLNQPQSSTANDARWARPSNDAAMIYTSCVAHDII